MMRRTYHGAQPDRTGGEDRPAPACAGRTEPYDTLIDVTSGPVFHWAVAEARAICSTCDLFAECMTANRGEPWAAAVLGEKRKPLRPEPPSTARGRAAAGAHERNRAARLEELRALIARGADVTEACRVLNVSRDGLWKWCDKWGHGDVWRALNPRPSTSNQYRRRDDIGEISLRRERPSRAKRGEAA